MGSADPCEGAEEKIMKTKRAGRLLAVTMLAGLLATSLAIAQKDEQGEVMLQAAKQKQLVDGDLETAIQLYKRIVREHSGNRAVAAQALLEMGQCYEKLGNIEATKAYERVLRDYGEQSEAAAQARARLAALSGNVASSSSQLVTRRVWAGPDVHVMGSLSPEGRFLSCVDGTTGDIALRDLTTGKMRRLTNEGSRPEEKASAISRDGKEVAYNWPIKDGYPDLRVVRVDGSALRVLYNKKGKFASPRDWSPDGKYILTLLYNDPMILQIAVISREDGSVRVLKTVDGLATKIKFSPDGRYIAYDLQQQDSGNRDIFLLASDGSREIRLIEHLGDDQLLGWTPDGNHILFASDRSGTMSAWMIRVTDGKPQGSPDLVKPDIGQIIPIGFTPAGSFYYGLAIGTGDVYTAEFASATGRVLTEPQIATQRYVGWNVSPAWSADGQYLAYLSRHRHKIITIRSLKTGEERDLSPKLPFMWGPIRWSPDGRSILVSGKDSKARHGLYLIDAQTAEATPIAMWQGAIDIPAFFPDGKRLLYRSWQGEAGTITQSILVRDLETGRETEFFRPPPGLVIDDIALSPDGRQVALTLLEKETRSSVLKVLPIDGGEASELVRAKEPETIVGDSLSWSSDSRLIVFGRSRAKGQERKTQLLAISSRGGEPHELGLAMDSVRDVSFHPDGHHLAFATSAGMPREDKDKVEVWVIENFLPTVNPARRR
jgi:Tol biopolymer transport system component